ncbi:hypothetical protein Tco_0374456 [Tanacetum coccineum]
MSTSDYIYPIIAPYDVDVEDAFSSTNTPDYTPASPDYSPASPGNTSPNPSDDLSKESSHKTHLERHEEQIETILNHLDELPLERIEHIEDKIAGFQREQIRHDDEIVLARVRTYTLEILIEDIQIRHRSDMKNLLDKIRLPWFSYHSVFSNLIINTIRWNRMHNVLISPTPSPDYSLISYQSGRSMKPLGSKPVTEKPNEMAPKRTSTSAAPAMTQAAIKKLVADSVSAALEAQSATK